MRLLLALLALAGCASPDTDAPPLETPPAITYNPLAPDSAGVLAADSLTSGSIGTFSGTYSAGFEHSGFVPCTDTTETWWTEPGTSGLMARYAEATGDSAGTFPRDRVVSTRLRGRVSARRATAGGAGFGHLGAYTRTLAVDSVEFVHWDVGIAVGCKGRVLGRP